MDLRDVVIRPRVTEKSTAKMADNQYTFQVALGANKSEIRRAVESIFKVKVVDVQTQHVRGKFRRMGRTQGRKPDWKKAVVTLAEGDRIEIFEGL